MWETGSGDVTPTERDSVRELITRDDTFESSTGAGSLVAKAADS